ncbi:MAG: MBL fold metallo-hydrolase, partial [Candidatus Kapabacteria bacterium]|nr:MBL fold metallo-hydrolase [Candidatus Kapabacteria bacterium]
MLPAVFGKLPSGALKERIVRSPNYRDGAFRTLNPSPTFRQMVGHGGIIWEVLFNRSKRNVPESPMAQVTTDLWSLPRDVDTIVWFGHSSYLLQVGGKRFLIDPVLCGNASPLPFLVNAYNGSNVYHPEDIPEIDVLVLTHDHWDHLDYRSVMQIQDRAGMIVTGLGTSSHLLHWGVSREKIVECDWSDSVDLGGGFSMTCTPARHFTGRLFTRNQTLWTSWVLQTPERRIYLGGDSGYDTHFRAIGEQYGPFDLAILECGQYNEYWRALHMMPEETAKAAVDLNATTLLPVHWAKFSLALHAWDDPIIRVLAEAKILG